MLYISIKIETQNSIKIKIQRKKKLNDSFFLQLFTICAAISVWFKSAITGPGVPKGGSKIFSTFLLGLPNRFSKRSQKTIYKIFCATGKLLKKKNIKNWPKNCVFRLALPFKISTYCRQRCLLKIFRADRQKWMS